MKELFCQTNIARQTDFIINNSWIDVSDSTTQIDSVLFLQYHLLRVFWFLFSRIKQIWKLTSPVGDHLAWPALIHVAAAVHTDLHSCLNSRLHLISYRYWHNSFHAKTVKNTVSFLKKNPREWGQLVKLGIVDHLYRHIFHLISPVPPSAQNQETRMSTLLPCLARTIPSMGGVSSF